MTLLCLSLAFWPSTADSGKPPGSTASSCSQPDSFMVMICLLDRLPTETHTDLRNERQASAIMARAGRFHWNGGGDRIIRRLDRRQRLAIIDWSLPCFIGDTQPRAVIGRNHFVGQNDFRSDSAELRPTNFPRRTIECAVPPPFRATVTAAKGHVKSHVCGGFLCICGCAVVAASTRRVSALP